MVQVPMYQARIPISGGGGHIDLREREQDNPILQALMLIQQMKRQGQPEGMQGQIVAEGGKTWLVDKRTGQKIDLGIPTTPRVTELLQLIANARMSEYEEPSEAEISIAKSAKDQLGRRMGITTPRAIPTGEPVRRGPIGPSVEARDELSVFEELGRERTFQGGRGGLFRGRGATGTWEEPTPKVTPPRKRVESKERSPKPKEYPDAKWSKEHQMWTIVKNGRLMGVK